MSVKVLQVLETVVASTEAVSPQDIRETTGIPSATVTRLLARLLAKDYVKKVGRGQYVVGKRLRTMLSHMPATGQRSTTTPVVFLPSLLAVADQIYAGLRRVLAENGVSCVMHPVPGWPAQADDLAREQIAESPGIVLFSMNQRLEDLQEEFGWKGTPAVHVGYSQFDVCDSVGWHERWTYQQLTTQLLERGCSTVVYFTPRRFMQNRSFRLRRAGYMDAIQDHGLQPHVVTMEDRPFSGTAESLSAALGNADGTLAGLVVSCDAALPPLFAAMEGHALGSRECLLTASVHCRGNLEEFPDLVDRVSLIAVEPWEEVGAVSGRRLLGRIRGDGSRPNVSLVRPEIDSHL